MLAPETCQREWSGDGNGLQVGFRLREGMNASIQWAESSTSLLISLRHNQQETENWNGAEATNKHPRGGLCLA